MVFKKAGKKNDNKFLNITRPKSRKELRKEKREAKKQRRRDYYARSSKYGQSAFLNCQKTLNSVERAREDVNKDLQECYDTGFQSVVPEKKNYINVDRKMASTKVMNNHMERITKKEYRDPVMERKMKEEVAHKELQAAMHKTRQRQLNEANDEEDKLIKKLEKKLKLSKRKSKNAPKSFAADGLDYLLDVCDSDRIRQVTSVEKNLENSDSDFEEDLALSAPHRDFSSLQKKRDVMSHHDKDDEVHSSVGDGDISEASYSLSDQEIEDEQYNDQDSGSEEDEKDYLGNEDNISEEEFVSTSKGFDTTSKQAVFSNVNKSTKRKIIEENISNKKSCENKKTKVYFTAEDEHRDINENDVSKHNSKFIKKKKVHQDDKCAIDVLNTCKQNSKIKVYQDIHSDPDQNVEIEEVIDGNMGEKSSDIKTDVSKDQKGSVWEDIYGRMRDKDGNVLNMPKHSVYVPPALRVQESSEDERTQQRLQRLKRQIKGCLNRLTESNLPSILSEMDTLYSSNSRHDMNTTFTAILLESIVTPVLSIERLVMEHVALVAGLHSKVGSDVGAYILQIVVKKFYSLFENEPDVENKELDNVILIICHLYHFKVVHSHLLFDILHCLADRFGSKELELILLMIRSVGFVLRKDDPSKMKSLMVQLQELARTSLQKCNESRVKFMLEILMAVKNNNMSRLPGWDPSPVDNMRKLLRSLLANSNVSPELNISLQDLLEADERGRWWVVGSAWAGQAPGTGEKQTNKESKHSAQLLELADRMRMNTDVRRNIFCVLMSAQDFSDAFTNLMQLGLRGIQSHEIVHVTLDCCLQEKVYNKFYAHVFQAFCDNNRSIRMTLQCDIWNKFAEVKSLTKYQLTNMVKLLQQLLTQGVLNLLVFKVLDFTHLEKPVVRILRQVLLGILNGNTKECNEVFTGMAQNPKHKLFFRKLHVFLQQFVLSKMSCNDPQKVLLQQRIDEIFTPRDL